MKNILVPTDFSDCAKAAEDIGFKIAKKANAEIHFLHLLTTPTDWVKLTLEKEKLYPETKAKIGTAKNELNELRKRAKKAGVVSKEFLVFDKNKVEITDHIEHHKHDFIIMGSHGTHGIKEVLGSNTQKVVRNAKVPVLVLKDKLSDINFKNIVFASTFQEDVHQSFHKVIEFADLMGAQIHLLNVNLPFHFIESDEAEENMNVFMKSCPRGNCTINIYNALNEERGIQKFAKKINADVISLTTHGKSGFMKMISPSITESLVNHSSFPILSVNIHAK
jgi:nucleotide-binding universal stress UspA family protein